MQEEMKINTNLGYKQVMIDSDLNRILKELDDLYILPIFGGFGNKTNKKIMVHINRIERSVESIRRENLK